MQNTAGDIALSFNDAEIYTAVRDAGIRTGAPTSLIVGMMAKY
jgi:protein arginine N-methyltransferase 2